MKRFFLFLLGLVFTMTVFAQKTTVAVGAVDGGNGVGSDNTSLMRTQIISGLAKFPRLNVIDVKNLGLSLSNLKLESLNEYNVDYLVTANIQSITKSTSTQDGKTSYKAEMKYIITITDTQTGQVSGTINKTRYGYSSKSSSAAVDDAYTLIDSDMKTVVNNYFRIVANIVSIDEANAKKGVITFYIDAGGDQGVTTNTNFDVYRVVEVAGQQVHKSVGTAKSKEISGGSLTLCKVTKGGKDIQAAIDNEEPLVVVSKPGAFDSFIDAL